MIHQERCGRRFLSARLQLRPSARFQSGFQKGRGIHDARHHVGHYTRGRELHAGHIDETEDDLASFPGVKQVASEWFL